MWRAFFFAIGITLILLGGQCLVVDQFHIKPESKLTSVISKLGKTESQPPAPNPILNINGVPGVRGTASPTQIGAPPRVNGNPVIPVAGSRFGPSRLQTSPFDAPQFQPGVSYYGGRPTGPIPQTGATFSLANYRGQTPDGSPSTAPAIPTESVPPKAAKIVQTKDWMPWSLLAAGMIVVLYTNIVTKRSRYSEE